MRRRVAVSLAAVLAVALGVGAWVQARARGPAVPVVVAARGSVVQTLVAVGRVMPAAEVTFRAREAGVVTQVTADVGDAVPAGQVVVQLDAREAEAALTQARATLAQAKAQVRDVRAVAGPAARSSLDEAQANLDEAEAQLVRDEALFRGGAITAAALDQSRARAQVTRSRQRSAELGAAALARNGTQWQMAIAAEAVADAGVALAEARVDRLRFVAPAAGVVTSREVDPGDVVQVGAEVAKMVMEGPTRLVIEPDEKSLRVLRVGQLALASPEAFPELRFAARVQSIAPAVDPLRGTVEVRLAVDEPPAELRTEMTVSVEIAVDRLESTVTLPIHVVRDLASGAPWVVTIEDGQARRRELTLGPRGDERVAVLDGIDEGAVVVDAPALVWGVDLLDGARVRTAAPAATELASP
jgi:HlyD family secretion protein